MLLVMSIELLIITDIGMLSSPTDLMVMAEDVRNTLVLSWLPPSDSQCATDWL